MRQLVQMPVVDDYIPFIGGLDTTTPQMSVNPGTARISSNVYQDIRTGYSTSFGYERVDGQASPSDAVYSALSATITGALAIGDTLIDTGTASGEVIAITSTYVYLTKTANTFVTGNILVGAVVVGTCVGPQMPGSAPSIDLDAQYKNLAADVYRADIAAVPGTGVIRGVVDYLDVIYAFRDNAGSTATDVYKSTSSGWALVDIGTELAFTSGGVTEIAVGDTITGATSTETAVVEHVYLDSGTWAGGDAAGTFVLSAQSGAFQAENLDVGASANLATIAGNSSAVTLTPGGTYEFQIANFGPESSTRYVYGCGGVDYAFQFNGATIIKILTKISTFYPTHLTEFKVRLILSIGPAISISALADPFTDELLTGGARIAMQNDITGLQVLAGQQDTGTCAIYQRNALNMLYDNGQASLDNWKNVSYNRGTGAIEWSDDIIGNAYFFDDRGIMNLATAQEYGNFYDAAESNSLLPWLIEKKNKVTHSCIIRGKNLYCIFFNDKYALYCTVNKGKMVALMPQFFKHTVHRVWSDENTSGNEVTYFGSDNGFIYQLDKGTSYDGENIEWQIDLAYGHAGSPYKVKRYRRAILEVAGDGYAKFFFSYSLGYASVEISQPDETEEDTNLTRSIWDSFTWDAFFWDGVSLAPVDTRMTGSGVNVSIKLRGESDYYDQIRFSGVLVQYSPTRRKR